jgi:hypothetical protein
MAQQIKITQTSNADMNIGVPKNLTAVEWLYEQLFQVKSGTIQVDKPNLFQQAKAMEKEQMIDSFYNGAEWEKYEGTFDDKFKQYYKETYNK